MCGRNSKLCNQKAQDPKRFRQEKNPPKEIQPWVQRTISNVQYMAGKKTTTKFKLQK